MKQQEMSTISPNRLRKIKEWLNNGKVMKIDLKSGQDGWMIN